MNWSKTVIAGVVGGIVLFLANFVLHAVILGSTYRKYPDVFSQDESIVAILWILVVAIVIAIAAAILFAKSRACWADGWKGGVTFGLWAGLFVGLVNFIDPLVLEGFPYFLAWCHLGCDVIATALAGVVFGFVLKSG